VSALGVTMLGDPLLLGAVAYDPKVVTIWEGFQRHFAEHGLDVDVVLYTSYERQVAAQLAGHVHVAWSSPLAWLQTERAAAARGRRAEAIAMRDTDRDLTSVIVVRADAPVKTLEDLRGKRVGVGGTAKSTDPIPMENLVSDGSKISFSSAAVQGAYEGAWDDASKSWKGTWTQNGQGQPLALTRAP